jgi:hypothetical protein
MEHSPAVDAVALAWVITSAAVGLTGFAYSAHPIASFPSADRVVANTILAGQQGTYRRIRPRVAQLLVGQTSALHLFEVRSTPLLMRMMPSMAWGRCVAEPIYQS